MLEIQIQTEEKSAQAASVCDDARPDSFGAGTEAIGAGPDAIGAGTRMLLFAVRAYQALLSPHLGGVCKFHPSCSEYAVEAIERFGAARGLRLAAKRLLRCRPFSTGGWDPLPEARVESGHVAQPRAAVLPAGLRGVR